VSSTSDYDQLESPGQAAPVRVEPAPAGVAVAERGLDALAARPGRGWRPTAARAAWALQRAAGNAAVARAVGGVQRAVTTWAPPVRSDETAASIDAQTFEVPISGGVPGFDKFSVFVPATAAADVNNVLVFFAANPVVGASGNDVMIHGLRGAAASAADPWILIGVPGFDSPPAPGFQTITTAQIKDCLTAAGRASTTISKLRLVAHSRGHRGLEHTLRGKLIDTKLIDRVTILDAFYQDTKAAIVGAGVTKSSVVQYDLIDDLGTTPGRRSRVPGDKRVLFNRTLRGTTKPMRDYLAAIGYLRLLQDLKRTRPTVAALIAANPAVDAQVSSVALPARGGFISGASAVKAAGAVVLEDFITANVAALDAILAIDDDPTSGLLAFINNNNLLGFGAFGRDIAAHHFFVAEIAHELFE
jgi:hypothetical protein